jgi:hypothetical protein
MIKGYFGVPGCGKTTTLVKTALKELKRVKKRYDHIYTINFRCSGCTEISWDDLATYKYYNSLILIDEITLNADNRHFKDFTNEHRDFFILHRHIGCDIVWSTQNYDKVDLKIRDLTQELWYMNKSVIPFLSHFTTAKRIYRQININEHTSELTLGYRFCNLLESFFVSNLKIIYRKPLYKHFDSYDELSIGNRPLFNIDNPVKFPDNYLVKGRVILCKVKEKLKSFYR